MDPCAVASVANTAVWLEGQTNRPSLTFIGGRATENVRHDVRSLLAVRSDTWPALLRRKTLHSPVSNVFRRGLAAQLPLQLGPAVDDRHQLVFFLGRQGEGNAIDTDLLAELQLIEHLGHAEDGDRQAGR